jgi:DNA (cytosine-5)-methyltransferase 1
MTQANQIPLISLFSGSGGLDLGFEQSGFTSILAYDKKDAAIETYNHNRENKVAQQADLLSYDSESIIQDITNLKSKVRPRGVIGGPPCQYFSNGNKSPRVKDDPRRILPVKYATLLKRLNEEYQLDFFLFENVKGLIGPKHREDFEQLIRLFEDAGFIVYSEVLDALNFNVPQVRKRVIVIGWNKQKYSEKTYHFPSGTQEKLTIQSVIANLPEPQFFKKKINPDNLEVHPNHWTMQPRSEKFKNGLPQDMKRSTRSFRRLIWQEPSYTVAYGHNEIHIHPNGNRRLSIYEAMLLQGFPRDKDGYQLCGSFSEQVTLVSDAVPPPLAAALAQSVREFMIND